RRTKYELGRRFFPQPSDKCVFRQRATFSRSKCLRVLHASTETVELSQQKRVVEIEQIEFLLLFPKGDRVGEIPSRRTSARLIVTRVSKRSSLAPDKRIPDRKPTHELESYLRSQPCSNPAVIIFRRRTFGTTEKVSES